MGTTNSFSRPGWLRPALRCALLTLCANAFPLLSWLDLWAAASSGWADLCRLCLFAGGLLLVNLRAGRPGPPDRRLRSLGAGVELLRLFSVSLAVTVVVQIGFGAWLVHIYRQALDDGYGKGLPFVTELLSVLWAALAEAVVFWHGIVRVYLRSVQLGITTRVLGAAFGWVPVAHLFFLRRILMIAGRELTEETEKLALNESRAAEKICATKYPLLLVHGVFFRDFRYLNYWGRIPGELEKNGATVYYGRQQSALPVADSAAELAERIRALVGETGCEKVNVIAHSKGGLDIRWAAANCGVGDKIASITTVSTPHRGCLFAEYLLEHVPEKEQARIAGAYNAALRRFGETPDFLAAVRDLTAARCREMFDALPPPEGVWTASAGSRLDRAAGGKFPLNFTYPLVKHFDGPNDGLVAESSFRWGERYTFLTAAGKRGISHGDMVDLNRENIPGFDVREFYVQLAADLKRRGL